MAASLPSSPQGITIARAACRTLSRRCTPPNVGVSVVRNETMTAGATLEFRLLGSLEVAADGVPLELGGRKRRALVALLLLEANRVVAVDRLIYELWADQPPARAATALQGLVSRLRKELEPQRAAGAPARILITHAA